MNGELARIWKKAFVVCFTAQLLHAHGETEENREHLGQHSRCSDRY